MKLKGYNEMLNSEHYVLKDTLPNAVEAFTQNTKDIIGADFNFDIGE